MPPLTLTSKTDSNGYFRLYRPKLQPLGQRGGSTAGTGKCFSAEHHDIIHWLRRPNSTFGP